MLLLPPGVDGFKVDRTRATHTGAKEADKALDNSLKGKMFYWDVVHPDGSAGHKFMGEIAAQVRQERVTGLTGGAGLISERTLGLIRPSWMLMLRVRPGLLPLRY